MIGIPFPFQMLQFIRQTFDKNLIKSIYSQSGQRSMESILAELTFNLASFVKPKQAIQSLRVDWVELTKYLGKRSISYRKELISFIVKMDKLNNEFDDNLSDTEKLMSKVTDNFYGALKGMTKEEQVNECIKLQIFLSKFSIEQVSIYVNHPPFMVILLQYIKETKLERVHQLAVLKQNAKVTYRAIENIIHISSLKDSLIKAV